MIHFMFNLFEMNLTPNISYVGCDLQSKPRCWSQFLRALIGTNKKRNITLNDTRAHKVPPTPKDLL